MAWRFAAGRAIGQLTLAARPPGPGLVPANWRAEMREPIGQPFPLDFRGRRINYGNIVSRFYAA